MLTALEQGVKGGKWFVLMDKLRFRSSAPVECLLRQAWAIFSHRSLPHGLSALSEVRPPTGEPCAGGPHARFGGGEGPGTQPVLPTPIALRLWVMKPLSGKTVPKDYLLSVYVILRKILRQRLAGTGPIIVLEVNKTVAVVVTLVVVGA